MNTAVEVADNVQGFAGPGTLYRIDPPIAGTDHVVLFYQPPLYGQQGRLNVILATETGAVFGRDVRPREGSYVTNEPNHYLALQLAGGYTIVDDDSGPGDDEILVQAVGVPDDETPALFDPAEHTVTEVNAYLAEQDDDAEIARVLELEAAGKARKTILTRWQQ